MRIINALLSTSVLLIFLFPQALAAPPGGHLNIQEVAVTIGDPDTTLEINGFDFDFGSPLEVTLAGVPVAVTSATSTTIIATVLTSSFPAGDYLLTVSTGNGQSKNDEYDLTIGAVGPQGEVGVSGYERVLQSDTIPANTTKTVHAVCPTGKRVFGGGYSSATAQVLNSFPTIFGNDAWRVDFRNNFSTLVGVNVFAICANVN